MSDHTPTSGASPEVPLGNPEAAYHSHTLPSRQLLFGGSLLLLASVVTFFTAELVEAELNRLLLEGAFAAVLLTVGACSLVYRFVFRIRVSVYENGVLVVTTFSERFSRWEEIEAALESDAAPQPGSLGLTSEDNFRCGFQRFDGRTYWFREARVGNLRDFLARLRKRIDPRVRADSLKALAAGEEMWFGPIGISRAGLHSHKGLLPWAEVSFAGGRARTGVRGSQKGKQLGVVQSGNRHDRERLHPHRTHPDAKAVGATELSAPESARWPTPRRRGSHLPRRKVRVPAPAAPARHPRSPAR